MFGLPVSTVVCVGGTVLIIVIALLFWGLSFREEEA
jgi:hypothetical protein